MSEWKLTTPVVFLIFNRPETTARVFAEIARVRPPVLLVVADGPRADVPGEVERCQAARAIIEQGVDWQCEILTNYADLNLGCRKRVSSGLDWVFDRHSQAIVLEDDCLPHQSFFRFCEELLGRYRGDHRIMHISGSNFQFGALRGQASYYFSRYSHVWGWASWSRAWQHYDERMTLWATGDRDVLLRSFRTRTEQAFWRKTWDRVYAGDIDTWDYQWAFECMRQGALSIVPNANMVSNIGFGRAASHTDDLQNKVANLPRRDLSFPLKHPPTFVPDVEADALTSRLFFREQHLANRVFGLVRYLSTAIRHDTG